uniref:Uncharacterized protein n=1 Tax=Bionectria ochroleuca TaxID=29856 RepID=A0A0B7JWX4_BIOOC
MRLPIEQVAHALDTFGGVHAREWLHQDAMVAFSLPFRWTKFRTAAESINFNGMGRTNQSNYG